MLHVSAIDSAAMNGGGIDTSVGSGSTRPDRRQSASNQAWLGRIVDGRYRVIEAIGSGGMGVVYKIEHVRMGKVAAMKVLHRDLANDPDVEQRFEREAAAVSRLHHPNTVQVFDFGATQGALYLVMEYVRGQDLGLVVDRDGPLPFARIAPLLVQILGALSEAHGHGIVHRDLKPENVLVARTMGGRDYAKVLDFGLAKFVTPGRPLAVSDPSQIVGTPYFMAPEQIRGEDVDARTDLYAMGALTYKLLTGTYPYDAKTSVGVLTKHLTAELELPSRRAPRLGLESVDEIIEIALAKDPAQRWATAAAMAEAVERAYADLAGEQAVGVARSSSHRRRELIDDDEPSDESELRLRRSDLNVYERSLKRQRVVVALVGGLMLASIVGAVIWWTLLRKPAPHRREVEPNNQVAQATKIAADTDVVGYLGKRQSETEGDVDIYQVELPGYDPLVTLRVSALPNIDLALTVRTGAGRLIGIADEESTGGGEILHRRRADRTVIIEISEVMTGTHPVENVSDAYTLHVSVDHADAGWETEPNGETSDATPINPGVTVRGYLDARGDVDSLRWDGPDGSVSIEVEMTAQGALVWSGPDQRTYPPEPRDLKLRHGDTIRLRRTDPKEPKGPLRGGDAPWAVTMVVKP